MANENKPNPSTKEKDLQVEAYNENFPPIDDGDTKVVPGGPEEEEFDPEAFAKMEEPKDPTNEEVFEEQVQAREETEAAADNIDAVPEPDTNVAVVDGATEIEPTKEELAELKEPSNFDPEYLEYSAEAVGFENREQQWDTYRIVANYIPEDGSVLDFGCARGDFERFFQTEFKTDLDYVGIDFNQQLIDAGKKIYNEEVELVCQDWFKLDDEKADWCININSSNLRYDADTTMNDLEYLQATIKKMYTHAEQGVIILLTSGDTDDGLINWNPGDILNWAHKEFGNVALDHSFSTGGFTLIIYKN